MRKMRKGAQKGIVNAKLKCREAIGTEHIDGITVAKWFLSTKHRI